MSRLTRQALLEDNNKLRHELLKQSHEIDKIRKDLSSVIVQRDKADRLSERLLKIIEDGVKESNFPRRAIP